MLSNAKKVGLMVVAAVAFLLGSAGAARAEGVQVVNSTAVVVEYNYSVDGGVTWYKQFLRPGQGNFFAPGPVPVKVWFFRAGGVQRFSLPYTVGQPVTIYDFLPLPGGGVDLYGPR